MPNLSKTQLEKRIRETLEYIERHVRDLSPADYDEFLDQVGSDIEGRIDARRDETRNEEE